MTMVKLAAAGAAIYFSGGLAGAAVGGWAGLASGAMLVGGVATILGTARGDKEGEKWSEIGGYLMLAGGLGKMAADKMATKGLDAAATKTGDAAVAASNQAPASIAQPNPANFTADAAKATASPFSSAPVPASPIPANEALINAQSTGRIGLVNKVPVDPNATTGAMDWMNKNPAAAMMVGQTVSGLATGLATSDAAAQAAEQARQDREARILLHRQTQYV